MKFRKCVPFSHQLCQENGHWLLKKYSCELCKLLQTGKRLNSAKGKTQENDTQSLYLLLHVLKSPRYSLIFDLLRAHYFRMANVQNFNALLVKFETNINNYASFRNTTAPDVARNIRSIRTWVDEQKRNSKEQSTIKK